MSINVVLESQIIPEKYDALLAFLKEKLPAVRGFQGCRKVSVLFNDFESTMIFDELWSSQSDHERYIAAIQENGVLATLAGFLKAPPQIRYFEELDI